MIAVTWLLVAGPFSSRTPTRRAAAGAQWLFSRKPWVFLGQHSLQVVSGHVMAAYLLILFVPKNGYNEAVDTAINLAIVATLFIPATLHARYVRQRKFRKMPGAGYGDNTIMLP